MISNIIKKTKVIVKKVLGIQSHPDFYTHGVHKRINITSHESFQEFSILVRTIISEKKTHLYYDRFLTIYDAIKCIQQNSDIVEIGSKKGGSTKFIASLANSNSKIYCCDTFRGHVQLENFEKKIIKIGDHGNVSLEEVKNYLEQYKNVKIIEGDILQTYKKISLENIGLVHLDVDVFIPTKFVLDKFFPLVKNGCIFILDDYLNLNTPGVKKAVDEFKIKKEFKNRLYFSTLLTGQAVIVKIY